jgi:hypothetical protein
MKFSIACALAALTDVTLALHFHASGRLPAKNNTSLSRRGNYGSALTNIFNLGYYVNVTIGGGFFSVLIDTGRYVLNVYPNENFLSYSILAPTFKLLALSHSILQPV